jgi:uncharacterized protein YjbI with pentapeptide repeats
MLSVVEDLWPLTVTEGRLLEKVKRGEACSFLTTDDRARGPGDKARWGADRRIRAAVLKAMLSNDSEAWGIGAGATVDLGGAVVSGNLTGFNGSQLPPLRFDSCRFDGRVDFGEATFTSDAGFRDSTFTSDAEFNDATFCDAAGFGGAIFTGRAEFLRATFAGDAGFGGATFTSDAWFRGATFGRAAFGGATFRGDAGFSDVTFIGDAWFGDATFTGNVWFEDAIFTGDDVWFGDAIFKGHAWFRRSTFTGDAWFGDATFANDAQFEGTTFTRYGAFEWATFTGPADFEHALACQLSFKGAKFSVPDPGPWIASTVSLEGAVMTVRGRVSITATSINASWLKAQDGAHLLLRCGGVDLSDSEFVRPSIVSGPTAAEAIPQREMPPMPRGDSLPEKARVVAQARAWALRYDLVREFAEFSIPLRCRVTSLARANVGELALSNVVLDDCAFDGADGLDKLRITGCSFQPAPRWWGWRRMGRRLMIAEELVWRQAHCGEAIARTSFLPAPQIAEIYRDLRKGLEEAKNEPGAADFYYGEMEMRRLAGRKSTAVAASRRSAPSWAERVLLYGYWAFSGYGLRASRTLTTFAVVIAVAAFLYTHSFFATETPPAPQIAAVNLTTGAVTYQQPCQSAAPGFNLTTGVASDKQRCPTPGFWSALDYSARESISLLQVRSTRTLDTTTAGTLLDFFLRLAGPVLLAFTVLALRARIKR